MQEASYLLTDEQMAQFITQGYLVLRNDLPDQLHEKVMNQIHFSLMEEGNPGNNILPRVPDIQKFFETPIVKGALTSILGPEYYLHPHRHCHYNQPHNQKPGGGEWHKDGYWSAMRSHRPWWAMIFYYTQPVTEQLGPTAIMPGSQYKEKFPGHDKPFTLPTGPAGTMVLVHFDLWHKASLNTSSMDRYMLKFQFARLRPPASPSWNNQVKEFPCPAGNHDYPFHRVWSDVWHWLRGAKTIAVSQDDGDAAQLATLLGEASEDDALDAAYRLAGMGEAGIQALLHVLQNGTNVSAMRAAYALPAAGTAAIDGLIALLGHPEERKRAFACFALGMIGAPGDGTEQTLIHALSDDSVWVRRNAAEALGMLASPSAQAVEALARILQESVRQESVDQSDKAAAKKDHIINQDYIQNKIGYTAALSLLRIGKYGKADEVVKALEPALSSSDRYVRAYAFEALSYLRSAEAVDVLLRYHRTARWCPDTHKASSF
ncbi:HEAT repeat domain-containing protein [Paenibacillus chungangensis]|uniref:HEAT repeat domain-containing protein n=1 Tax=Paenibacillus chungangensis TaxID=696535 RepID=A0ABW3HTG8_9BACL